MLDQSTDLFVETPFEHSESLLTDYFFTDKNHTITIKLSLFKEGLKLENSDGVNKWFPLDFEVKFTLLLEKQQTPFKSILGEPYGLQFERAPTQNNVLFYSKDKQTLLKWRDQLCKLINQRGFHDLYKPFKKIGKGNSATVYLAERLQDQKRIAIKAFAKQSVASQPKGKQSLINQIQIMRCFNHKALMKLFQVFETDNSYYLAIQHLDGGQLFQKVNNRRFNLRQIQQILRRLAQGLIEMHKKNIIHRDLKPQNLIFRTPNDFRDIVIADYGLATKADIEEYIFIRCGTPGYVAPQIINFKGKSGQQTTSDIFSLGIIAHILATGRSPFSGKQYQQVLNQNRLSNFNFNLEIYKYVDSVLLDLIKKMMKVDPAERIKTQQILEHQFFNIDKIPDVVPNQEITQVTLPHQKNCKKGLQKIFDSGGSFVIGKPQILKGNDEQYTSMNNVGSSNSVSCSPQSIKISSFVATKRERESTSPIDSQFKVGHRKAIGKGRPNLIDLKAQKHEQGPKQSQKQVQPVASGLINIQDTECC